MSDTRTAAIVVASTRAAAGVYDDETGPILRDWLAERGFRVDEAVVVADADVRSAVGAALADRPDLLLTTGGTGIAPGDGTVEAVRERLDVELPGIGEELRRRGLASTPFALLSRETAGFSGRTAIVTLPGSPGGVRDGLDLLDGILDHLLEQRRGEPHGHGHGGGHGHGHD